MTDSPAKSEWIVVGLALLGLAVAEGTLRVTQDTLSGDVEHLNEAEGIVRSVADSEGLGVLLFGNSLLFSGVMPDALEADLEERLGRPVTVGQVNADGTGPLHWSYLARKLVFNPDRLPDVLVIAFGDGHLMDRRPDAELLRLAAHHVDGSDVGMVLERDLTGLEVRSQFLLARASTAFALRDRIAPRVFDLLIPRYRELAPMLLAGPPPDAGGSAAAPGRTYEFLERLLQDASTHDMALLAMPMPAPDVYSLADREVELFQEHGVPVLGTNADFGFTAERFPDRLHLDAVGGERFTELLAPILAEAVTALGLE